MTDWLVRRFVADADNVGDPQVRQRYGLLASVVSIVCNVLLFVGKAALGWAVGSLSIVADAVNNLSDMSSNVVSLLGFRLASRPADEEHPYGHGRYEYLASLGVAVIIIVVGLDLVRDAVGQIRHPQPTQFGLAVVLVLVGSIAVKLWMMRFNEQMAQRISSETLHATAIDSRNDVLATSAVLAAALISHVTGVQLDGWMGLAVGCLIVWGGIDCADGTLTFWLMAVSLQALTSRWLPGEMWCATTMCSTASSATSGGRSIWSSRCI